MKKHLITLGVVLPIMVLFMTSCSVFDADYGKSEVQSTVNEQKPNIKIPEIKSDDENMPTYFDISIYDEENYADIYLGKDFKYKVTYSGGVLALPASYNNMVKDGWNLVETDTLKLDSKIMAGKSAEVQFEDSYGKRINAVFYNQSNASKTMISCPIVKFIVGENFLYNPESEYGQFWVNGVSNESAITDVIECLGSPSHFYKVDENNYYLDYFLTKNDKRSKITVYIDLANDSVTKMEFSIY